MCISPFLKKKLIRITNDDFLYDKFPCGKCYECLKLKAKQWAFRFNQEMLIHNIYKPLFITLTYDETQLLWTNNGYATLNKKDLQDFVRRLRYLEKSAGNKLKIIYYGVGEYGHTYERPHYHILLLNVSSDTHIEAAWSQQQVLKGIIHFGATTDASIAYTMKYLQKITVDKHNSYDDRQPEFAIMSKRIGENYIKDSQNIKYHQGKPYIRNPGGHIMAMPRYYRDKLFDDDQKKQYSKEHEQRHQATEQEKRIRFEKDNPGFSYEETQGVKILRDIQQIEMLQRNNRNKI